MAVALLALCGVLSLMQQSGRLAEVVTSRRQPFVQKPVSSDPLNESPVPGVMALPPANLKGDGADASQIPDESPQQPVHLLPPDSRTAFSLADLKAQMPQRADGTFVIEVPTLHFSTYDAAARQVMAGRPVETMAQIAFHTAGADGTIRFRLSRLLTRCCSADARPYFVTASLVSPSGNPPFCSSGSWVTVRGHIAYEWQTGGFGAVIAVESITETSPPPNPVLH